VAAPEECIATTIHITQVSRQRRARRSIRGFSKLSPPPARPHNHSHNTGLSSVSSHQRSGRKPPGRSRMRANGEERAAGATPTSSKRHAGGPLCPRVECHKPGCGRRQAEQAMLERRRHGRATMSLRGFNPDQEVDFSCRLLVQAWTGWVEPLQNLYWSINTVYVPGFSL
jgi:hypothetical protein